ncbi:MAG: Tat pathway signal protein, partial [Luteimonas sp.]
MRLLRTLAAGCVFSLAVAGCQRQSAPPPPAQATAAAPSQTGRAVPPLIDELEHRTFDYFWELTNPSNGLVPDRWPTPSPSSIAAVGFGLTAYGVGAERGWITRDQALDRTLATLRFFARAPQGPDEHGAAGYKGFYYHFLEMDSGLRSGNSELSTVDTTLLLGGVLFAQSFFDRDEPREAEV